MNNLVNLKNKKPVYRKHWDSKEGHDAYLLAEKAVSKEIANNTLSLREFFSLIKYLITGRV